MLKLKIWPKVINATLFDRLNVYEHLVFYALLKGRREKEVEKEFDDMLIDLGIPHKRYCYPSALSGGMKRKLSVAIAFIGGMNIIATVALNHKFLS